MYLVTSCRTWVYYCNFWFSIGSNYLHSYQFIIHFNGRRGNKSCFPSKSAVHILCYSTARASKILGLELHSRLLCRTVLIRTVFNGRMGTDYNSCNTRFLYDSKNNKKIKILTNLMAKAFFWISDSSFF